MPKRIIGAKKYAADEAGPDRRRMKFSDVQNGSITTGKENDGHNDAMEVDERPSTAFTFDSFPLANNDFNGLVKILGEIGYDFHQVPDEQIHTLWLWLLNSAADSSVAALTVTLMNKLVATGLGNSVYFISFLDYLIAYVHFFQAETDCLNEVEVSERQLVEDATYSAFEQAASIISSDHPNKLTENCEFSTYLPLIERCTDLLITYKFPRWSMVKFLTACLRTYDECQSSPTTLKSFKPLITKINKLISCFILECEMHDPNPNLFSDLFIFVAKVSGIPEVLKVINDLLLVAHETKSSKPSGFARIRQILINSLSSTPYSNDLLHAVIPSEKELIDLIAINYVEESDRMEYLITCAKFLQDQDHASRVMIEVICTATIRCQRSVKLVNKASAMVQYLAQKEGIKPRIFFVRNAIKICYRAAKRLLDLLWANFKEYDPNTSKDMELMIDSIIEYFFYSMSVIFAMSKSGDRNTSMVNWLSISTNYFVPYLLLSMAKLTVFAQKVLQKTCEIMSVTNVVMLSNICPYILWISIGMKKLPWSESLVHRIIQLCDVDLTLLMDFKPFKSIVFVLFALGMNEEHAMSYLEVIYNLPNQNKASKKFSFTDCVKPFYLGVLLEMRRVFVEDSFYHYRSQIVQSLVIMIKNLSREFLSQTPKKMIEVLKVAVPVEDAVDAWVIFLERLTEPVLIELLPYILLAVAPLSEVEGASRIMVIISAARAKANADDICSQRFDQAVYVLYDDKRSLFSNINFQSIDSEALLKSCAVMLQEEGADVQCLVLPKMIELLDEYTPDITIIADIVNALIAALKTCSSENGMLLIGICLGQIGAVDPGRIGMAAVGDASKNIDRRAATCRFIDDLQEFFEEVLESTAKLLTECTDPGSLDFIAYVIQQILKELKSPDLHSTYLAVMNELKPEVVKEITPFSTTAFTAHVQPVAVGEKPFVLHSQSYESWIQQWYVTASEHIKNIRISRMFNWIKFTFYTNGSRFAQNMICQIILQAILEKNDKVVLEALREISAVFQQALNCPDGWIRLAVFTCFQVIEMVEKYDITRYYCERRIDLAVHTRLQKFLHAAVCCATDSGDLVSVIVAEKYNCSCRALRWLEQFGCERTDSSEENFNRRAMYALERIYFQLSDTDGVLGAFNTIQKQTIANQEEQIVAYEATGNYTEALPLYEQNPDQKVQFVKCFLRLNQPLTAYNLSKSLARMELEPRKKQKLLDYQLEAAYRRHEWSTVKETLSKMEQEGHQVSSWGAHVASVLSGIKERSQDQFETRINRARLHLMESLKALSMDDTDTYSQAYRYVQRLHVLFEIENGAQAMNLFSDKGKIQDWLLERWQVRSENVIQCSGVLEPIYSVRRNLLRLANPSKGKEDICQSLLDSCKMARQSGQLSTAWSHLVEARALQIKNDLEIDMEESRYHFQSNQSSKAIANLQWSLRRHFPDLVQAVTEYSKYSNETGRLEFSKFTFKRMVDNRWRPIRLDDVIADTMESDRKSFVSAQMLLTSFIEKDSAANVNEIYDMYNFMNHVEKCTEELAYRFAVFYDASYYVRNPNSVENVIFLLQLYRRVLGLGRRYVLHAMPRMLSVWLDFTAQENPAVSIHGNQHRRRSMEQKDTHRTTEVILDAFTSGQIDRFYFYTSFSQLISHLCHPMENVYNALQQMIVDLIIDYPHECLWQAIASYRANARDENLRHQRIRKTFEAAIRKAIDKKRPFDLKELIRQYDYISNQLIKVAEFGDRQTKSGEFHDFNRKFPDLADFFAKNNCKVSVPFITMVEKRMPTFMASQLTLPEDKVDYDRVYIKGFKDSYLIFASLERPKRITMIGSNGVEYRLMAKRNDELRKDARVLDFCRKVNTILLKDPEARRRQLHIRTYSVIALQSRGGIIEWVPNLTHFRAAISSMGSGTDSNENMRKWQYVKSDKNKIRAYYDELVQKNPVQMANFLRCTFTDPCKWYGARLAFTRTAATMSMVGFVLGLGDRHGENILIDYTNGDIVHVDFNVLFNRGEDLPVPEKVPFRLTRNLVDGFGPTGVEGSFRTSCEIVMKLLRREQAMLCTVLQTFIHDPCVEFNKIEDRNQQMRGATSRAGSKVFDESKKSCPEIDNVRSRLAGNIVTRRFHPLSKSVVPMNVESQVAKLINMATDPSTLAEMYIGWNPHL